MWWGATALSRKTQLCTEMATVISLLLEARNKTLAPQLLWTDTQVQSLCVCGTGAFLGCGKTLLQYLDLQRKKEKNEGCVLSSIGNNWKLSKLWDVDKKKNPPKEAIIYLKFYEVISVLIQKEFNKTYFKMLKWDRISFHAVVSAHFFEKLQFPVLMIMTII